MGYGKLAKGISEDQVKKKLETVMPSNIENKKQFQAKSQSIFIGSHNYPKVNVGTLSPTNTLNPELMDNPARWYKQRYNIKKIASLRTSLVNSKQKINTKKPNKMLQRKKEIAITKKPAHIEVKLDKKPFRSLSGGRTKPISASADLNELKIGENPSVEKKLEKKWYDTEVKAETAINELTNNGIDNYKIQQALTAGILGEKNNRKLVPTRWSITATDDMISKKLRSNVKNYQELGEIQYYNNSYLGNKFHIFLIPGKWEYELMELKRPKSVWNQMQNTYIAHNYEPYQGRTAYAEQTAGAFYATRLAVLEHLTSIKKQAKVLVVREVTPDYWAPLGVWIIRESVRNSFENGKSLDNHSEVKEIVASNFRFLYKRIENKSKLLSHQQRSLADF